MPCGKGQGLWIEVNVSLKIRALFEQITSRSRQSSLGCQDCSLRSSTLRLLTQTSEMRNFTALLFMFHLVSISNAGHESEISQGHYQHKSDNLPPGSDVILDDNCVRARGKTSLIDIPNQTRNLETRNLETETFEVKANATYLKVQPCLTSAWIMDSWETKNFTFPLDAEEHFRSLKEKTEIFRNTKIHQYANYGGT